MRQSGALPLLPHCVCGFVGVCVCPCEFVCICVGVDVCVGVCVFSWLHSGYLFESQMARIEKAIVYERLCFEE